MSKSHGSLEQMISAFESRIDELGGSTVESCGYIGAAKSAKTGTKLRVVFEEYKRYQPGRVRRATVSGKDRLDALKKMVDRMGLYLDSDYIEEEGMTADEVIENIEMSNGDGCDFIFSLQDLTTGETLIEADGGYDDNEEW